MLPSEPIWEPAIKSNPIFILPLIAALLLATPVVAQGRLGGAAGLSIIQAELLVQRQDFKDALVEVDKAAAARKLTAKEQKFIQEFRDVLRANMTEPVDYSKFLKCDVPNAATPQRARAIYTRLVSVEEPDRIKILRRGNSWLVFQGTILITSDVSSYGYLGVPMEGAHHLAKVNMCDGSVLPDLDAHP